MKWGRGCCELPRLQYTVATTGFRGLSAQWHESLKEPSRAQAQTHRSDSSFNKWGRTNWTSMWKRKLDSQLHTIIKARRPEECERWTELLQQDSRNALPLGLNKTSSVPSQKKARLPAAGPSWEHLHLQRFCEKACVRLKTNNRYKIYNWKRTVNWRLYLYRYMCLCF